MDLEAVIAYLVGRALRQGKKNPKGLLKNALLEYTWHLEYLAEHQSTPKPEAPAIPDPPACDCGGAITTIHPGDRGRCGGCGALWELDPELEDWTKTQDGWGESEGVG